MKKISFKALFFSLFLLIGCVDAYPPNQNAHETTKWLFTFAGSEGTLQKTNQEGEYILTLKGISNGVAFTERPQRDMRSISAEEFLDIWNQKGKNSFKQDPPNSALEFQDARIKEVAVFVLSSPKYNPRSTGLTFKAKQIKNDMTKNPLPEHPIIQELPKKFDACVLVVDDKGLGWFDPEID